MMSKTILLLAVVGIFMVSVVQVEGVMTRINGCDKKIIVAGNRHNLPSSNSPCGEGCGSSYRVKSAIYIDSTNLKCCCVLKKQES